MFCPSCGAEYHQTLKFCKSCGANLNSAGNVIKVNISKPPIASMTWASVLFSFLGGLTSLLLFIWSIIGDFGDKHYKEARVGIASFVCLLFTCLITLLLIRHLGRLTRIYQDTVRQSIKEDQIETNTSAQAVLPPQQSIPAPSVREPLSSVTDNTTRSL